MILKKNFIFVSLIFVLLACKADLLDINIEDTTIETRFTHLDSIIFNTPEAEILQMRKEMGQSINEIFDYQIGYCMRIGRVHDTAFVNSIMQYRADESIQVLEGEIATKFKDLSPYKKTIHEGLRYLKTHLPDAPMPTQVVFQNTLFNSSAFCTEKEIGIGLEQYLGKNSTTIKRLPSDTFYDWMKEAFDKRYLERDAILSWVLTHILPEASGNLAEEIIYYGKALYITEAAFPKVDKSIILRYSPEDYKWALEKETLLWKYIVDENLLFKSDDRMIANLTKEGPFTPGLPDKGPDRLGQFLGWMMVRNYMQETKKSMEELIDTPYNAILQKYEPK